MVQSIVDSGLVPEGALSLICGGAGDLLEHLDSQDVVTFTGSATTGQQLRVHPNLVAKSIPFTMEADSLNCCVLGDDVTPEQPEFALFIREVVREMTAKAGQKCTAIRRIIVPQAQVSAVSEALIARLEKVLVGDPAQEGAKMGALVNSDQRRDVQENVNKLIAAGCEIRLGGRADLSAAGAFFPPTLLFCPQPDETPAVHAIEAFGPVATLMPYQNREHALTLARAGEGSLVGTLGHRQRRAGTIVYSRRRPLPRAYSDPQRRVVRRVYRPRLSAAAAGSRRPGTRRRRRRARRPAVGEALHAAHGGSGQPDHAGRHLQTVGSRRAGGRRPRSPRSANISKRSSPATAC
ncbi:3,4-dehydroadipyl-CoA semialdehyde dehydrogenase [Raoultella terrigena]|uniref:3,4-dehydroadipyl-CoA semialdehyde dehydrogenase n=1 Tax=Raoultella terrigena TaxID=577 RepID=A0A4U9CRX2_RAOTE|nr:3,4-dehydroadipyl-CoA semialdehyde dehydrogenase [Raoultella terrigena]